MNQFQGGDLLIGIKDPKDNNVEIVGINNTDLVQYQNPDKYKNAITQKLIKSIEGHTILPTLNIK